MAGHRAPPISRRAKWIANSDNEDPNGEWVVQNQAPRDCRDEDDGEGSEEIPVDRVKIGAGADVGVVTEAGGRSPGAGTGVEVPVGGTSSPVTRIVPLVIVQTPKAIVHTIRHMMQGGGLAGLMGQYTMG